MSIKVNWKTIQRNLITTRQWNREKFQNESYFRFRFWNFWNTKTQQCTLQRIRIAFFCLKSLLWNLNYFKIQSVWLSEKRLRMAKILVTVLVAVSVLATIVHCDENANITCGINQVYTKCVPPCPKKCAMHDKDGNLIENNHNCDRQCEPGCECKKGYVINYFLKGQCVLEKNCFD